MFAYMKQKPGFYKQVLLLSVPIVLQNLITRSEERRVGKEC